MHATQRCVILSSLKERQYWLMWRYCAYCCLVNAQILKALQLWLHKTITHGSGLGLQKNKVLIVILEPDYESTYKCIGWKPVLQILMTVQVNCFGGRCRHDFILYFVVALNVLCQRKNKASKLRLIPVFCIVLKPSYFPLIFFRTK